MTEAEKIVWELLRNRRLDGKKFLRQHKIIYEDSISAIKFFVADFYCAEEHLVLEIDGHIHDSQKEYDQWRTSVLNELGLRVLRIQNHETHFQETLLAKIRKSFLKSPPSHPFLQPRPGLTSPIPIQYPSNAHPMPTQCPSNPILPSPLPLSFFQREGAGG